MNRLHKVLWLLLSSLFSSLALAQAPISLCDPASPFHCASVNSSGQVSTTAASVGAADTVGSTATFNANSVCALVAMAGQQSSGFTLNAGTLAATLTPQFSNDVLGTNWTTTQFVDQNGAKTATLIVTNPNAASQLGVLIQGGARRVQVCTTSFTSGSATGFTTATFVNVASGGGGGGGGSVTQGTTPWVDDVSRFGGINVSTGTGASGAGIPRVTFSNDSAIANLFLLDATFTGRINTQGQKAMTASTPVVLASDQASIPVAATLQTGSNSIGSISNLFLLDATFTARINTLGQKTMVSSTPVVISSDQSAIPVSQSGGWTVTTTPPANASENITQFGGVAVNTGTGASGTGTPRVTVANDSNILVTQSGTWTVQPGNTANTTPWLATINQGGNSATVTGANALKVDGSGVTQPVSGAFFQTTQPISGNVGITDAASNTLLLKGPGQTAKAVDIAIPVSIRDSQVQLKLVVPPQVQIVDQRGHNLTVKGPGQPPTLSDPALVITQSPIPTTLCPYTTAISQTANVVLIPGKGGARTYICLFFAISTTAQSVSLTEGTGTTCGTGASAIMGSTTVANGMPPAANGGWVVAPAQPILSQVNGDDVCLLQSGAGLIAGTITYAQY